MNSLLYLLGLFKNVYIFLLKIIYIRFLSSIPNVQNKYKIFTFFFYFRLEMQLSIQLCAQLLESHPANQLQENMIKAWLNVGKGSVNRTDTCKIPQREITIKFFNCCAQFYCLTCQLNQMTKVCLKFVKLHFTVMES